MHYALNSFTGRLIGASHLKAYNPAGIKPLVSSEPSTIIYHNVKLAKVPSPSPSHPAQGGHGSGFNYGRVPESIKRNQERFQKADGVLVHLKGGPVDKVLYGLTMALSIAGLAGCFKLYYELSFPRINE